MMRLPETIKILWTLNKVFFGLLIFLNPVDLEESVTSDDARTSAGYQKTGDLITLPYTEVVATEQPFASTVERVAPFLTARWEGVLSIDPTQDNWFEHRNCSTINY